MLFKLFEALSPGFYFTYIIFIQNNLAVAEPSGQIFFDFFHCRDIGTAQIFPEIRHSLTDGSYTVSFQLLHRRPDSLLKGGKIGIIKQRAMNDASRRQLLKGISADLPAFDKDIVATGFFSFQSQ